MDPNTTRISYDRVAANYATRIATVDQKPFDCAQLDQFLHELAPGPVWDLGCGPGDVTRYLSRRRPLVTGIDLSGAMLQQATRANPQCDFRLGDMTRLDAAPASLAGITAFYSLIHVPPEFWRATLTGWFQALAPGGRLLLAMHLGTENVHLDSWLDHPVDLDFHFTDQDTLVSALRAANFQIATVKCRQAYPELEVATERIYTTAFRSTECPGPHDGAESL